MGNMCCEYDNIDDNIQGISVDLLLASTEAGRVSLVANAIESWPFGGSLRLDVYHLKGLEDFSATVAQVSL